MNLPVEVIDAARAGRCWIVVGSHATAEAYAGAGRPWMTEAHLTRRLERAGNGGLLGAQGGGAPPSRSALDADLRGRGPVLAASGAAPPSADASSPRSPLEAPGGANRGGVLRNASPRSIRPSRTERPSLAAASSVHAASHGHPSLLAALRAARDATDLAPTRAQVLARTLVPVTLTTTWDDLLERAADTTPGGVRPTWNGGGLPHLQPSKLVHLRGSFAASEGPVVTQGEHRARPPRFDDSGGQELRHRVLFFVGYRPEDEEFALLVDDIAAACGGHLPRCHVAVAGGPMDDYLFQKWVWKGLLLFMADPTEALEALHKELA